MLSRRIAFEILDERTVLSATSAAVLAGELEQNPLVAGNVEPPIATPQVAPAGTDETVFMQGLTYTFTVDDFGFSDPGDVPPDLFSSVRIASLPERGTLMALGAGVATGQFITLETIQSAEFSFTTSGIEELPYARFTFQVVDDSSPTGEIDPTANTFTLFFDDPDVDFIRNAYQDILQRSPESDGLISWVNFLNGGGTPSDVIAGLWDSFEHRGLQVDEYYQRFFDRVPDPGGRLNWIAQLQNSMTEEEVIAALVTTPEYLNTYVTNEDLLVAYYNDLFGRAPDQNGFDFWLTQLDGGILSRTQVGTSLVGTFERDLLVVFDYYDDFYGRLPDQAGLELWSDLLFSGALDDRSLAIELMSTAEYFNRPAATL